MGSNNKIGLDPAPAHSDYPERVPGGLGEAGASSSSKSVASEAGRAASSQSVAPSRFRKSGFYGDTYTVESVTVGHPDKVCDQISDAILAACVAQDAKSRVAVECLGGHGTLIIMGEVTTTAKVDYADVARRVYRDVGYTDELDIQVRISEQSPDIAQGVDTGGAGDQGIMYGFACDETPELLPHAVVLVRKLTDGLTDLRRSGRLPFLGPDGKAQITVTNGNISTVIVSAQHTPNGALIGPGGLLIALRETLLKPIFGNDWVLHNGDKLLVNTTGSFSIGGFEADTGLTGRKQQVDAYCGLVPHGGGALSGKDNTKVDRSAAFMARLVASDIVKAGHAQECLVSVAYAIGVAQPLMVTARDGQGRDLSALARAYDWRPSEISKRLVG